MDAFPSQCGIREKIKAAEAGDEEDSCRVTQSRALVGFCEFSEIVCDYRQITDEFECDQETTAPTTKKDELI